MVLIKIWVNWWSFWYILWLWVLLYHNLGEKTIESHLSGNINYTLWTCIYYHLFKFGVIHVFQWEKKLREQHGLSLKPFWVGFVNISKDDTWPHRKPRWPDPTADPFGFFAPLVNWAPTVFAEPVLLQFACPLPLTIPCISCPHSYLIRTTKAHQFMSGAVSLQFFCIVEN